MKYLLIFPYYLSWHYSKGIAEVAIALKNFVLFVPEFFSIGTLLKTLFSPFQRLKEHYSGGLKISEFFEVITVNILMRLVGLVIRSFFITLGVLCFIGALILAIILFFVWLVIPLVLAFFFFSSIIALFN